MDRDKESKKPLFFEWQPQAQLGDGLPHERESAHDQSPAIPKAFGLEAATR